MKKTFLLVVFAAAISGVQAQQSTDRVGYANMEYIISSLPDVKAIETEMMASQTEFKDQIETKTKALQKAYSDFNANVNTMPDTTRENAQRKLQQSLAELEKFQQDAQVTLQNKQKLYMAPVYLQVNRVIAEVAKENGFAVILNQRVSGYNILLYNSVQQDVSDLVLKKFGVTPAAAKE